LKEDLDPSAAMRLFSTFGLIDLGFVVFFLIPEEDPGVLFKTGGRPAVPSSGRLEN
jgi:hypothetical protein